MTLTSSPSWGIPRTCRFHATSSTKVGHRPRGRTLIRTFLNSHPTEAFGVLELAKAIQFPVGPIVGTYSLHATLHRMAAQGKIEERIVRSGEEERHVLCDDGLIGSPPISGQGPIPCSDDLLKR